MRAAAFILCIILTVAGGAVFAAASYIRISSNSASNNAGVVPTMLLAENATTSYVGDTLQLTATLSDESVGVLVTFYQNGTPMGTTTTVNGGVATLDYAITSGDIGTNTWTASAQWPAPEG